MDTSTKKALVLNTQLPQATAKVQNIAHLQPNDKALVVNINGDDKLKDFLLIQGIVIGTIFYMNYSPSYTGLTNITIGSRMVCVRNKVFAAIDWLKI